MRDEHYLTFSTHSDHGELAGGESEAVEGDPLLSALDPHGGEVLLAALPDQGQVEGQALRLAGLHLTLVEGGEGQVVLGPVHFVGDEGLEDVVVLHIHGEVLNTRQRLVTTGLEFTSAAEDLIVIQE